MEILLILRHRLLLTKQGKLLTKLNPRFLKAYLGWPVEADVKIIKYQNIKIPFYLFITILCAKISSVNKPLQS